MDSSHSFNMLILSILWSWDLFGSKFLITFSMSSISKAMKDKDSFDFRGHSDGILLLLIKGVHCLENSELKISAFCLKSVINLLSWKKIGGITGIFLLFKNVFNTNQYILGLALGSTFEQYLFFELAINELSWLWKDWNTFVRWWIVGFEIEFSKYYLMMSILVKRRVNTQCITTFGGEEKIRLIEDTDFPWMWVGSLIIGCSPNWKVMVSVLEPSKAVVLPLY